MKIYSDTEYPIPKQKVLKTIRNRTTERYGLFIHKHNRSPKNVPNARQEPRRSRDRRRASLDSRETRLVRTHSRRTRTVRWEKSLDLEEFLRFYDDAVSNRKETKSNSVIDNDDAIVSAFNVFDVNGDGYISSEELRTVLERLGFEEETKSWDCGRMIRAHDKNLDGVIDIEEFKNMMLHVQ